MNTETKMTARWSAVQVGDKSGTVPTRAKQHACSQRLAVSDCGRTDLKTDALPLGRLSPCYIVDGVLSPRLLKPHSEAVTARSQSLVPFRWRKERERVTAITLAVTARRMAAALASQLAGKAFLMTPLRLQVRNFAVKIFSGKDE
jgi:hypothetical protein